MFMDLISNYVVLDLFMFAPAIALLNNTSTTGTPVDNSNLIEENDLPGNPMTYIVINLATRSCIGIYPNRVKLLNNFNVLTGETVGIRKLNSIIASGGIIHTTMGSYLIAVTHLDLANLV